MIFSIADRCPAEMGQSAHPNAGFAEVRKTLLKAFIPVVRHFWRLSALSMKKNGQSLFFFMTFAKKLWTKGKSHVRLISQII